MAKRAKRAKRVPVSRRAIVQRIKRKLAASGRRFKASRGSRARADLGEYYILNERRNVVAEKYVDLEAYARELGALAEWEILAKE